VWSTTKIKAGVTPNGKRQSPHGGELQNRLASSESGSPARSSHALPLPPRPSFREPVAYLSARTGTVNYLGTAALSRRGWPRAVRAAHTRTCARLR
jgi:hypothetical protein